MYRAIWAVLLLVEILNELEFKMNALAAVLRMLGQARTPTRLHTRVPEGVPPELLKKHWFYNKKRRVKVRELFAHNGPGAGPNAKIKKLRLLVDIKDIVDPQKHLSHEFRSKMSWAGRPSARVNEKRHLSHEFRSKISQVWAKFIQYDFKKV